MPEKVRLLNNFNILLFAQVRNACLGYPAEQLRNSVCYRWKCKSGQTVFSNVTVAEIETYKRNTSSHIGLWKPLISILFYTELPKFRTDNNLQKTAKDLFY